MKNKIILLPLLVILVFPVLVGAQQITNQPTDIKIDKQNTKDKFIELKNIREKAESVLKELKGEKIKSEEEIEQKLKTFQDERRKAIEEKKSELLERAKQIREEKKEEIEKIKEEFRQKIQQIKDEKKIILAERLSEKINNVNRKITNAYLRHLDHLEEVLNKIEDRTLKIETKREVDLSETKDLIDKARNKIDEVRTAVLGQQAKEYVVEIESVENLEEAFRNTVQQMIEDHKKVRDEIKDVVLSIRNVVLSIKDALKNSAGAQENNQNGNSTNEGTE